MIIVFGFYCIFALFYFSAIQLTTAELSDNYYHYQIFLDYPLKALFTLPIWWLMFQKLSHWSLIRKVGLHLILLPVYVKGWQLTYYATCNLVELGHLGGTGEWWDVYITTLFYVLQFGIFHSYDYYQRLAYTREQQLKLQQASLQSELTALKAQLNPHFLYNTFNTINASVPATQEHTRELVANLADLFRYQLRASQIETVPLSEELNFVNKYLELEKARFGERLRTRLNVSDAARHISVPPMLLQPLVENAIKHGISSLVEGGIIEIKAIVEHDELAISVSDTGVGFANGHTNGTGIGLANTRRRLQLQYDTDIDIQPNQPQGTIISFTIPIANVHAA